jgi:hypothetical protein
MQSCDEVSSFIEESGDMRKVGPSLKPNITDRTRCEVIIFPFHAVKNV